jgi:hypothetical protein
MKEIIAFICITFIYLISLYFIFKHFEKKKEKKEKENTRVLSEIRGNIEVIAMPRNYIINVVHSENVIDTTQYADMVVNIDEFVKNQSLKDNKVENAIIKVFMKDVNFSIYKTIQ